MLEWGGKHRMLSAPLWRISQSCTEASRHARGRSREVVGREASVVRDEFRPRRLLTTGDHRRTTENVYNSGVNSPVPPKPDSDDKHRHHHAAYAAEATGLLLMAALLLILIIIGYWQYIPWSAR